MEDFDRWKDILDLDLSPERLQEVLAGYRDIFAEIEKLRTLDLTDTHPAVVFEPTAPYRAKTDPSLPPPVTPYCTGILFSLASVTTRSTNSRGVTLELSTARITNPLPISASPKRLFSSGESELTKVSMANTKSGEWPSFANRSAAAAAPFNPTSSSVDQIKVTSRPEKFAPSAFTAAINAAHPTRSSKLRAFARLPSSGRYSFGMVAQSPGAIPNFLLSSAECVPTYRWTESSMVLKSRGHSNPVWS